VQVRIKGRLGRAAAAASLAGALLGAALPIANVAAATCLSTGALDRDGSPLTAKLMNPGGTVSGTVDATGCSVGVYFSQGAHGRVDAADVSGARYYGVLVDGNNGNVVHVDVSNSSFHDIGDTPLSSVRHGQGVAFRSFGAGSATGSISNSAVWNFQEAGLNATGPGSHVTMTGNTVTGRGPQSTISQNGVQVIFGAHATVEDNTISGIQFTGPFFRASGILITGGPAYNANPTSGCLKSGCDYTTHILVIGNTITDADSGITSFSAGKNGKASKYPTANLMQDNLIQRSTLTNTGGWAAGIGYQAGISDQGNTDKIVDNTVSGDGYDQAVCGDAAVCRWIDVENAIAPYMSGNTLG